MEEVRNASPSMREYIQIVDMDEVGANAPISAIPADMVNTRVSQILNSLRELHAITSHAQLSDELLQKLDQATALITEVTAEANQLMSCPDEEEVQVEETAPTAPDSMAPSVDAQGHRSYKTASGQSFAQQQGFTG